MIKVIVKGFFKNKAEFDTDISVDDAVLYIRGIQWHYDSPRIKVDEDVTITVKSSSFWNEPSHTDKIITRLLVNSNFRLIRMNE